MKNYIILLFCSIMVGSCSLSKQTKQSNSNKSNQTVSESNEVGSSYENPVVIKEKSEMKGIKAEYQWLDEHYPGYKMIKQSLNHKGDKVYDVLEIKYHGNKKSIYFDITNFFGKF